MFSAASQRSSSRRARPPGTCRTAPRGPARHRTWWALLGRGPPCRSTVSEFCFRVFVFFEFFSSAEVEVEKSGRNSLSLSLSSPSSSSSSPCRRGTSQTPARSPRPRASARQRHRRRRRARPRRSRRGRRAPAALSRTPRSAVFSRPGCRWRRRPAAAPWWPTAWAASARRCARGRPACSSASRRSSPFSPRSGKPTATRGTRPRYAPKQKSSVAPDFAKEFCGI